MISSKYFWIGAILFAIIPVLVIDIAQHSLEWKEEVRGEIISVVHNQFPFTRQEKAAILDRVFERNQKLMFLIYVKSFVSLVLIGAAVFFFRIYGRENKSTALKPVLAVAFVLIIFLSVKVFLINGINNNDKIKFLSFASNADSFQELYNENFKGKVVYVDFWGTTCGPCLEEFRDFTKPLKDKYKSRQDISYLYISQGNRYLWKEQIKKYDVEGHHIFLDWNQYEMLFRKSTQDSLGQIFIPRYLVIDKNGKIVVTNAKQPSDRDSLYWQLDFYLDKN